MTISRNGDIVLVNETSYRLAATDHQKTLRFAAACAVLIPRGLPLFFSVLLEQASSGVISVQGESGLTVGGTVATAALGDGLKLLHSSAGVWDSQVRVEGAGNSVGVVGSSRVAVTNRCGFPNLVQPNMGTAGLSGKGNASHGNCGILTAPRSSAGSGMPPGTYTTALAGGTPAVAGSVTYTVDASGAAVSVAINPGLGYNTAPTCTSTAAGAGGGPATGTVPVFGTLTIGASASEYFQQSGYQVAEDCWDLELHLGNFIGNGAAPGQTDNGLSTLTRRMGLRLSGVAAALPLYGPNGSRDVVLEPGAEVFITVPGPYYKGQTLWFQDLGKYATIPTHWPVSTIAVQASGSEVCEFGTNLTDNSLATAAVGGLVHSSVYAINPPISIIGKRRSSVTTPVIALLGDSIASTGSQDSGNAAGYVGFFQRTLAGNYGFLNLGASGYGNSPFMATAAANRLARWRKYKALQRAGVTHLFTNWVTNDISGSVPDPTLTVVNNLLALRDELQVFGIKLIPMTCCPRTSTANTGNATIDTANGPQWRLNVNVGIRSAFSTFYDLGLFMQDAGDPTKWDTTRNPGTVDEIHPSAADHIACANPAVPLSFAADLPRLLA